MAVAAMSTPQPHLMPGYTGHCPQVRFRIGDTYGSMTHKILLDPSVVHAEKLILSDRTKDDFQTYRPPKDDMDIVNARHRIDYPIYKHPMIPGYEGFVPRLSGEYGQRFTVSATEAMAEYERENLKQRLARHQLKMAVKGNIDPRNFSNNFVAKAQFRLPLHKVRPECVGILKDMPVDEPFPTPSRQCLSPHYKSDSVHREKDEFSGCLNSFRQTGKRIERTSKIAEIADGYKHRNTPEWAPINLIRPDPPLVLDPTEIYHRHIGLLPNYMGHIPGVKYRQGRTFGSDTKDAKRWFRGNFLT